VISSAVVFVSSSSSHPHLISPEDYTQQFSSPSSCSIAALFLNYKYTIFIPLLPYRVKVIEIAVIASDRSGNFCILLVKK
jgi:hypothetical protein